MEENQSNGFKIGLDKPETESDPEAGGPPPDKTAKKRAKSERKSPGSSLFLLFLGFLVLAVALVWFYYDIQDRLKSINTSGSEEVAELSRDLNEQIADINNQISALQQSVQKEVGTIQSSISDTRNRIDKLQASVASFEENLGGLKQTITPLKGQIQKISSDIGELNGATQELKAAQSEIRTQLDAHSEKIQMISDTMVDQKNLDKALAKEREFNKQNMAHATETLFSELASYEDKLKTMRGRMDELQTQISSLEKRINRQAVPQGPIKPPSTEPTSEMMPVPENGQIVEQEIE